MWAIFKWKQNWICSLGDIVFYWQRNESEHSYKKHTLQSSYHLYILGDDELQSSYEWLQSYLPSEYLKQKITSLPSKTFMFVLNEWEKKSFLQLHNKNVTMQKKHAILNYFLSCMSDNDIIFSLFSLSVKKSYLRTYPITGG